MKSTVRYFSSYVCWKDNIINQWLGEITEFTELWEDHCPKSDYGSTTLQIDIAGRSSRLTRSVLSDACTLRQRVWSMQLEYLEKSEKTDSQEEKYDENYVSSFEGL